MRVKRISRYPLMVVTALFALVGGATVAFALNGEAERSMTMGTLTLDDAQEARMADGVITFSEYENAISVAVEGARSGGVQVTEPSVGPDGVTLSYSVADINLADGAPAIDVFDECYDKHAHAIDLAFQTSPEVADARTEFIESVAECVYGSTSAARAEGPDLVIVVQAIAPSEPSYAGCRARSLMGPGFQASVEN